MNEQLQAMLVKIAEKLGTTAEHLWEVLLRQVVVDGWINIFWYVVGCICAYLYCKYLKWAFNFSKTNSDDSPAIAGALVFGIIMLLYLCFVVVTFRDTVTCFTNPEYMAVNKLVVMIRGF